MNLLKSSDPTEKILHLKDPRNPAFRFEWHPKAQKVYMVRVARKPEVGEVIAFNIENHGAAHNTVMIFMRGYNECRLEKTLRDFKTDELLQRVPKMLKEMA